MDRSVELSVRMTYSMTLYRNLRQNNRRWSPYARETWVCAYHHGVAGEYLPYAHVPVAAEHSLTERVYIYPLLIVSYIPGLHDPLSSGHYLE